MTPQSWLTSCVLTSLTAFLLHHPSPREQPVVAKGNSPYSTVGTQQVKIEMPGLKSLCSGHQVELFRRYLEASPDWRVGVETRNKTTTVVAYRRYEGRITLNGFVGEDRQQRAGFVFASEPDAPAFLIPCVTTAAPDAGPTGISICDYRPIPNRRVVHLYVGAPSLWLSLAIVNQGAIDGIVEVLVDLERECAEVGRVIENIQDPLGALKPDATKLGEPILSIDDTEQQALHLEAWVNPGEPGVTNLRVRSGADGKALTISHAELYSRERVGYSPKKDQLFYANSYFSIKETATGWNTAHELLFQLWFTPDSGGPARVLVEKKQTIKGWEN